MRIWTGIVAAVAVSLLAASPALATTNLVVTQNGLTAPNANYGCPAGSLNCLTSLDYQLLGPADALGSIVVDDTGTIATISMDVASATFAPTGGGANIVFSNVHYAGAVTVFSTSTIVSQTVPGSGTVTGLIDGNPFSTPSAIYNLTCAIGGTTGQCGVAFGPQSFSADGHDWLHTFAVLVKPSTPVPEPSTILFVVLGAAGLTLRRRRR
jgi:PEP-CTERM motif